MARARREWRLEDGVAVPVERGREMIEVEIAAR